MGKVNNFFGIFLGKTEETEKLKVKNGKLKIMVWPAAMIEIVPKGHRNFPLSQIILFPFSAICTIMKETEEKRNEYV